MLDNTCRYSFQNLFDAANQYFDKPLFYKLSQEDINRKCKELCALANWGWEDRLGSDGIVYTAFAPYLRSRPLKVDPEVKRQ